MINILSIIVQFALSTAEITGGYYGCPNNLLFFVVGTIDSRHFALIVILIAKHKFLLN